MAQLVGRHAAEIIVGAGDAEEGDVVAVDEGVHPSGGAAHVTAQHDDHGGFLTHFLKQSLREEGEKILQQFRAGGNLRRGSGGDGVAIGGHIEEIVFTDDRDAIGLLDGGGGALHRRQRTQVINHRLVIGGGVHTLGGEGGKLHVGEGERLTKGGAHHRHGGGGAQGGIHHHAVHRMIGDGAAVQIVVVQRTLLALGMAQDTVAVCRAEHFRLAADGGHHRVATQQRVEHGIIAHHTGGVGGACHLHAGGGGADNLLFAIGGDGNQTVGIAVQQESVLVIAHAGVVHHIHGGVHGSLALRLQVVDVVFAAKHIGQQEAVTVFVRRANEAVKGEGDAGLHRAGGVIHGVGLTVVVQDGKRVTIQREEAHTLLSQIEGAQHRVGGHIVAHQLEAGSIHAGGDEGEEGHGIPQAVHLSKLLRHLRHRREGRRQRRGQRLLRVRRLLGGGGAPGGVAVDAALRFAAGGQGQQQTQSGQINECFSQHTDSSFSSKAWHRPSIPPSCHEMGRGEHPSSAQAP